MSSSGGLISRRAFAGGALLLGLGARAGAQGFAGLGERADGFAPVVPGKVFSFPGDHGPHPDFRIEWWYVTANLTDANGNAYGAQWTLFRQASSPGETTSIARHSRDRKSTPLNSTHPSTSYA